MRDEVHGEEENVPWQDGCTGVHHGTAVGSVRLKDIMKYGSVSVPFIMHENGLRPAMESASEKQVPPLAMWPPAPAV